MKLTLHLVALLWGLALLPLVAYANAHTVFISEVLPNPMGSDRLGEWIELHNPTAQAIALGDWKMTAGGRSFTFPPEVSLAAGEYLQVSRRYSGLPLRNAGDTVVLFTAAGVEVSTVTYAKIAEATAIAWNGTVYQKTVLLTPRAQNLFKTASVSRAPVPSSAAVGDSTGNIVVSEVLPNPVGSDRMGEWIEIQNLGEVSVRLAGWMLDDKEGGSNPYVLPAGTVLAAGELKIFARSQTKLALNNSGAEKARLLSPSGVVLSEISFTAVPEGVAVARDADGEYRPTRILTPNEANQFDLVKLRGKVLALTPAKVVLEISDGERVAVVLGSGQVGVLARLVLPVADAWQLFARAEDDELVLAELNLAPTAEVNYPQLVSSSAAGFIFALGTVFFGLAWWGVHLFLVAQQKARQANQPVF